MKLVEKTSLNRFFLHFFGRGEVCLPLSTQPLFGGGACTVYRVGFTPFVAIRSSKGPCEKLCGNFGGFFLGSFQEDL